MTRGQRGRQMGRAMIGLAAVGIVLTVLLFLAEPGTMGGGPPVWSYAFLGLAVVGVTVGLVWMVRIYRADPEPDHGAWRYRARR